MKTTTTKRPASQYEIDTLRSQIRQAEHQVDMAVPGSEDRRDRQRLLDKLCEQLAATGVDC